DETCDEAGGESERGRATVLDPFGDEPGHATGGGGDLGVGEGDGGRGVGGDGGAAVETEPAEPEESCAEGGEDEGVGLQDVQRIADALADVECTDEGGSARGDVHDGAAGEVDGADGVIADAEPAAAPDPVCEGTVDNDGPEDHEQGVGAELDA